MKFPERASQRHQQDLAVCNTNHEVFSTIKEEMPTTTEDSQQSSTEAMMRYTLCAAFYSLVSCGPTADHYKSGSTEPLPVADLQLLARLEEANRMIEADSKSLNSLSGASGHSRKSSTTSQISLTSAASLSQGANGVGPEETEEDGWCQWGRLVTDWEAQWKRRSLQIREMVRRGVPHHFRPLVWQLICQADRTPEKKMYAEYMTACSPYERQIRRDINRTYPEHDFFKEKDGLGQESLFNVIKAYSLYDREVGYCQGSAFIVGLLLMQMPEEEAFTVLIRIMQQHGMREMYKPPMAMLGLCLFQLESMVQEQLPELQMHFRHQSVPTSMYASSWFLTLFTTVLSLNISCRIMDVFLMEGMEIIFKVAMALLTMGKDDLMSMDMEAIQKYFHKDIPEKADADPDSLMNLAFSIKFNTKKMKKMEKEYAVIKSKEQEEMSELRKLRSENRSLRCVVDSLELESASLAEKLVRWQVEAARGAETEYALQQQLNEAERRLQAARENHEQEGSRESSLGYVAVTKEEILQRDEMITCLQEELVKVRLSEAENDALIKELRGRIAEMEQDQKSMRETAVDNSVAHLQEELIAVKLREAEANLSLKDLRHRVSELSDSWTKHLQEHKGELNAASQSSDVMSTPKKLLRAWENRSVNAQKLEDELMSTQIREVEAVTELKELRLKVMELETQVQVSSNQLRRQDEEKKCLGNELEDSQRKVRDLQGKHKEQNHRLSDLQTKSQYEQMLANIRNAEDAQKIAELNQEISVLKMKNQVILTEGELRNNLGDSEKVRDLQDVVAELKAEVLRLQAWKCRAVPEISEERLQAIDLDLTADLDAALTE